MYRHFLLEKLQMTWAQGNVKERNKSSSDETDPLNKQQACVWNGPYNFRRSARYAESKPFRAVYQEFHCKDTGFYILNKLKLTARDCTTIHFTMELIFSFLYTARSNSVWDRP